MQDTCICICKLHVSCKHTHIEQQVTIYKHIYMYMHLNLLFIKKIMYNVHLRTCMSLCIEPAKGIIIIILHVIVQTFLIRTKCNRAFGVLT